MPILQPLVSTWANQHSKLSIDFYFSLIINQKCDFIYIIFLVPDTVVVIVVDQVEAMVEVLIVVDHHLHIIVEGLDIHDLVRVLIPLVSIR